MPRKLKIHLRNGCRSDFWRAFLAPSASRVTESPELVTCLSCQREIAKLDLLDLRDRSEFPTVPTFNVRASGEPYRLRGRDESGNRQTGYHLAFRCPVCGRENIHGGLYGQPGAGDGHRSSHCRCWRDGYFIREVVSQKVSQG